MRDGILWVAAANLVIWTGIFLYLMRLERRLTAAEGKRSRS
jgi:CcmD family protein